MSSSLQFREFLYVSHLFPPLLGGGVARTAQNCKLLPQFGWRPTVLTTTADGSGDVDKKYAELGVEVLRASGIIKEENVRALPRGGHSCLSSIKVQLLRSLAAWTLVPDRQVLWKLPAQRLALHAAKRHNWQCVLGTLHPVSAAWVGKCIAQRLRLPFILEYRDVIDERYRGGPPTILHRTLLRSIERSMVRSAAKIITVSPGIRDWVAQRHNLKPEEVEVIPTGFLPENKEFFQSLPRLDNDRFTMLYAGTFQRDRKPDTILNAVRILIENKTIPRDKLRVIFISNLVPSVISQFGLDGIAEVLPMLQQLEVFKWYAKSDLLLLLCDKTIYQNVTLPGKLFEYLMTEKPILGLTDKNSEIAGILRESDIGFPVDADCPEETATEVERLYNLWNSNKLIMKPNKEFIERFNSRHLIQKLVSVLEESVAASGLHKKAKVIGR